MMGGTVVPISNLQLAFTVFLVLIAGGVSAFLKLGLLRSLLWGTVRTFGQLTLVGLSYKKPSPATGRVGLTCGGAGRRGRFAGTVSPLIESSGLSVSADNTGNHYRMACKLQ
jgi:hypothetical protein